MPFPSNTPEQQAFIDQVYERLKDLPGIDVCALESKIHFVVVTLPNGRWYSETFGNSNPSVDYEPNRLAIEKFCQEVREAAK